MKYFGGTYGDAIKFDKKSNEDFYLVSRKFPIFVVADGVARSHFSDGRYTHPFGSRKASEIFCKIIIGYLEENFENNNQDVLDKIKNAFDLANQKIKEFNIEKGIHKKLNYVEYDWLDVVGVVGIIWENKVYYGYVGDCGLVVFDSNNNKKFQTKEMVTGPVHEFRKTKDNWKSLSANERKYLIRIELRNNANGKGYGTFSGEEGVKNYYVFGKVDLVKDDMVVFYTDGFAEYLEKERIVLSIRKNNRRELNKNMFWIIIKNLFKYGCDRTFVAINVEG